MSEQNKLTKTIGDVTKPSKANATFPFQPHSARTGRTVFSQLSAAVVRHKANDGVAYAI